MKNSVCIQGRYTKDLELKGEDKKYVRFSLACDRGGKNDKCDFISCVAYDKTAEFICKYFKKGDLVLIDGRITVSDYEKDGKKVYSTDVTVTGVYFCGKREEKAEESKDEFMNVSIDEELPFK